MADLNLLNLENATDEELHAGRADPKNYQWKKILRSNLSLVLTNLS